MREKRNAEDDMELRSRISVRNLVEFILRSGDLDQRRTKAPVDAMLQGGRIHRMIQKSMGPEYDSEVSLSYEYRTDDFTVLVEGRADGVITKQTEVWIDEIKGTCRDLNRIKKPVAVHLAQAKCYAYIYGKQKELDSIGVRMTYCNMETDDLKYFYQEYSLMELQLWFESLMEEYKKWAVFQAEWKIKRQNSITKLEFPFSYREGQKELAAYVYRTIYHEKKLFIEAPTGVGKTVTTLFPSVKATGTGKCDKIFYLTAKTITRTAAEQTLQLLRENGLDMKSVILTAKEKICFTKETKCNPEDCPYAKGHFDRINDALYALVTGEDSFDRGVIEEYARKYRVCPFELCLDASLFSDFVICDYNYVFDPHVYLKRFFQEGSRNPYVFLIDEAHNLLERGRSMYSAVLEKEEFLQIKNQIKISKQKYVKQIVRQLDSCNRELLALKRKGGKTQVLTEIESFIRPLTRLSEAIDRYFDEYDESPFYQELLDFYFQVSHFLEMYDRVDDHYVVYSNLKENQRFELRLFCVDPSRNLQECMDRAKSSILFSATLLPIQYYKRLLGGEKEDYEVYAKPVFDPEKRALLVSSDVTSKYTRRCAGEYENIAAYIYEIIKNRHGNYMVFFPSYSFMQEVYEKFRENYGQHTEIECIFQSESMTEEEREKFLKRFTGNRDFDFGNCIKMEVEVDEEQILLGFCVLGGIFGEGIDLTKESLIGVIIVGTGIPQVCEERELLKNYFDRRGENGFDYAYRFPGLNKVMQAAGRVIRTADDVGIIALLDERFTSPYYYRLFPEEWSDFETVTLHNIGHRVERFWDEWL